MNNFIRVSYADPCRACGRTHGCSYIIKDRKRISLCVRDRTSGRLARDGRGIWISPDNGSGVISEPSRPIPARIQRRDTVYRAMLDRLKLEDTEHASLRERGLSEDLIAKLNYKTTKDVAEELSESGYILDRVAGFYREDDIWKANIREGFFIPVRDFQGRIQALQMRTYSTTAKYKWFSSYLKILPDGKKELLSYGASSGAPIHHVKGTGKEVWVTEGILKADVIGLYTGFPILGKAGVGTAHKDIAIASRNFDKIILAFDQDWIDNINVMKAMNNQYQAIKAVSHSEIMIASWPREFKGLDDFLVSGETKIVVSKYEDIIK